MTENPAAVPPPPPFPLRWLAVILFVPILGGVGLVLFLRPGGGPSPELPVLATLPDMRLTAQDGRPFGPADLRGTPFVADFFFTRCPTICPKLTASMAELQKEIVAGHADFRLLSISVDPTFDSPEVLSRYASAFGARPGTWTFVTGPFDAIRKAVVGGFLVPMPERPPATEAEALAILHTGKFVLVDGEGRIRGYYDSDEPGRVRLLADARRLSRREGGR